jgi:hypothetical protein
VTKHRTASMNPSPELFAGAPTVPATGARLDETEGQGAAGQPLVRGQAMNIGVVYLAGRPHAKVSQVVDEFVIGGHQVSEVVLDLLDSMGKPYDLILIDAPLRMRNLENLSLSEFRQACRAPLVLLVDAPAVDVTVSGILAGADAVIPVTTPRQVIVAHCRALVRRCAGPLAAPQH